MLTKNELKYYSSLLNKKHRCSENKFLAEGKKIVEEGINSKYHCEAIFATHQFNETHNDFLESLHTKVNRIEIIKNQEFQKLCDTVNPQGIAAVFNKPPKHVNVSAVISNSLAVCLEDISDPGNVGTIIRNCDWFGVNSIILSKDCADVFNPKTIRASMGSIFHVNVYEDVNIISELKKLSAKGYEILCADLNGDSIFEFQLNNKSILVFSNEANGPSPELLNVVNKKINIPKFGHAESLNVASSSAIILSWLINA